MKTLVEYVETIEHGLGLIKSALAHLPGDNKHVALLRVLVQQVDDSLALSDMRTAMAGVESDFSARAQAAANEWPTEPTKPE
jgi:hypothetical protein